MNCSHLDPPSTGQNPTRVAARLRMLDKMQGSDCTTHAQLADELDQLYKDSMGQRNSAERDVFCETLLRMRDTGIPEGSPPEARLYDLLDICYQKEACARDTIRKSEELGHASAPRPPS